MTRGNSELPASADNADGAPLDGNETTTWSLLSAGEDRDGGEDAGNAQ